MTADRFSVLSANWVAFPDGNGRDGGEPAPVRPLVEVLDAAASAGFSSIGLEHYSVAAYVRDGGSVDDLAALLRTRGLRCSDVGIVPVGDTGVVAAAERLAHLAGIVGAPICIAALYRDASHDDAVRDLRAAAAVLSDAGVRMAFEFTAYGYRRSLADAIAICDAVGWKRCGLLVDTWHVFRGGEDLAGLRRLSADRIALVHVNDGPVATGLDPLAEGRSRRLPVGAGTFRLAEFAGALDAIGYRGPISVEVLSSELRRLPPADGARQLLDSLRDSWPA